MPNILIAIFCYIKDDEVQRTSHLPRKFEIPSTEFAHVECFISSPEMTKVSGPYSIPVNVLHMLKNDISIPLSKIFNLSLRTHPDCLKLAMVIPIHKKESKLEVGNYRPISLPSNINKLLLCS